MPLFTQGRERLPFSNEVQDEFFCYWVSVFLAKTSGVPGMTCIWQLGKQLLDSPLYLLEKMPPPSSVTGIPDSF